MTFTVNLFFIIMRIFFIWVQFLLDRAVSILQKPEALMKVTNKHEGETFAALSSEWEWPTDSLTLSTYFQNINSAWLNKLFHWQFYTDEFLGRNVLFGKKKSCRAFIEIAFLYARYSYICFLKYLQKYTKTKASQINKFEHSEIIHKFYLILFEIVRSLLCVWWKIIGNILPLCNRKLNEL